MTAKQVLKCYETTKIFVTGLAPPLESGYIQWCIAKTGGGYTQTGVAKGLKVPCSFMITEVSIRCQKIPEVGICRIPAYTPQYTNGYIADVRTVPTMHAVCQQSYSLLSLLHMT